MRSCVYFLSSILGWTTIRLGRGIDSTNAWYFATQVISQPILQFDFNKATINHKEINNLNSSPLVSVDQFWFLDIVSPHLLCFLHQWPYSLNTTHPIICWIFVRILLPHKKTTNIEKVSLEVVALASSSKLELHHNKIH
jgi:hypothetical protein